MVKTNKMAFKEALKEGLKKQAVALIIGALVVTWTFAKDLLTTGANAKFSDQVVLIVTTDDRTVDYFTTMCDSIFDVKLDEAIKDPFIWYEALATNFVSEYAEQKAKAIRDEVEAELVRMDSINKSFVTELGKSLGIRDEDVVPKLGEMLEKYIDGRLGVRRVTATF